MIICILLMRNLKYRESQHLLQVTQEETEQDLNPCPNVSAQVLGHLVVLCFKKN